MARIYKYGGVGLALPHRNGGRQDGVEERLVDRLPLENICEAGLSKRLHPGADLLSETEKGRGHRVDIT